MDTNATAPPQPPASTASPRFTMELEFVSCLANPAYLQYLGTNFHHLLNPPDGTTIATTISKNSSNTITATSVANGNNNTDAAKFARYLQYLLYWKQPEYSRFLTHPAATIRNLELLQTQVFRASVEHPDLQARLAEGFVGSQVYEAPAGGVGGEGEPGPIIVGGINGTGAAGDVASAAG